MEGVITNGPCGRCGKDHGRTPKHWRNEVTGDLYFFCSSDCRQIFVGAATRQGLDKPIRSRPHYDTRKAPAADPQKQLRKALDAGPKESDISSAIGKKLDNLEIWNTRINSGIIKTDSGRVVRLAKEGTPDRVFACGVTVWLEVKRPGKNPTPDQAKTIRELNENGSIALVVDNENDAAMVVSTIMANVKKTTLINKLQREILADINRRLGRE
jgi:hypothetical protein